MLTKSEKKKIREYRQATKGVMFLLAIFFIGCMSFEIISKILFPR